MADELQGLAQQGEPFLFGSVWVFIMKWFRQAQTGPEPGQGSGVEERGQSQETLGIWKQRA